MLANRFVRPVIIAFTGRLVLSTFGLFMVIVNALVLWIAALVAPDLVELGRAALLWLLVIAALYTAGHRASSAVLGLNRPRGLASRVATAAMWRLLESLPTPRRNLIIENLRLQQGYDASTR